MVGMRVGRCIDTDTAWCAYRFVWVAFWLIASMAPTVAWTQVCPAGSAVATFTWSTSPGSGNEWLTTDQSDGASRMYTISYTDAYGNPGTVDLTLTIQDPNGRNCDANLVPDPVNWPNDPDCANFRTETNGVFGSGFLTFAMKSLTSSETVRFDYAFSKPVFMDDFSTSDIDDIGFGFNPTVEPGDSFQDRITLIASNGGANVPLTLAGGSNVTIAGQVATSIVVVGVNGLLLPTDAEGTLTVSTSQVLDAFSFIYQNGPADATNEGGAGVSDSHAVRMSGFDFCVEDAPPDLDIVKTASPAGAVAPGGTITYTIEVTNNGPGDANAVTVDDTLPAGVAYVPQSTVATGPVASTSANLATAGVASQATDFNGTFTAEKCNDGDQTGTDGAGTICHTAGSTAYEWWQVDLGQQALIETITIFNRDNCCQDRLGNVFVMVSNTPFDTSSATLANLNASLTTADFSSQLPAVVTGDEAVSTGGVFGRYVRLQKSGTNPGGNFFNLAEVEVAGSVVATIVKDNVPGGANSDLVAGTPPTLVTAADSFLLPPGETMTVTFDVTVDDPLAGGITSLTNNAEASATGVGPVSDDATNPLGGDADVSVAKTLLTAGPYTPGQTVTYSLLVSNAGPATATNIVVRDGPTNLTITGVSGGGCVTLPCTLPSLAAGTNATIIVTATVQ